MNENKQETCFIQPRASLCHDVEPFKPFIIDKLRLDFFSVPFDEHINLLSKLTLYEHEWKKF